MTCRFFLPVRAAVSILCLFFLTLAAADSVHGQTTAPGISPGGTPVAAKVRNGYVRFWNLQPATGERLELVPEAEVANGRPLLIATPSNYYATYSALPPDHYTLLLFRNGDRKTPLKRLDLLLQENAYFTIAVQPGANEAASLVVEVVDDTPNPKTLENCVTVRQCHPGSRVIVTAARTQSTEALSYGATQILNGLPNGIVPLAISISTAKGTSSWNTEVDFKMSRHATLFVIADVYGRIRPRVVVDGPVVEPSPSPTTSVSPKPSAVPARIP